MSATPIPRTLALTIFKDMDITEIKTKPLNRKPKITKLYKTSEIKEVLYEMLDEIKKGHQIYVVSPLIENEEEKKISQNVIIGIYDKSLTKRGEYRALIGLELI